MVVRPFKGRYGFVEKVSRVHDMEHVVKDKYSYGLLHSVLY